METIEQKQCVDLKNILLATDFSEVSRKTVPYAETIARRFGSKVHVVHVIPPEARAAIPLEPWPPELDSARIGAEEEMKSFLPADSLGGISHEVRLEQGPVWSTLSDLIRRDEIDLLVLGTHGRGGLKKLLMGSVAEEIFRLASCPVLTVGPAVPAGRTSRQDFRRILFATDFGSASLNALPYAIALATDFEARLVLLHVVAPAPVLDVGPYWYAGTNIADIVAQQKAAQEQTIHRLKGLVKPDLNLPSEPEFLVDFDYAPDGILKIAADAEADLIVMGVNQSAWARVSAHLPWATAHEVVRGAKCPVLTVRC